MRSIWFISPIRRFISSFKREPLTLDQIGFYQHVNKLTDSIVDESNETNQRTGMRMFCRLPGDAANRIIDTNIDPYHKEMTRKELYHWIEMHLFFDENGKIIAMHNYGNVIWRHPDFYFKEKK